MNEEALADQLWEYLYPETHGIGFGSYAWYVEEVAWRIRDVVSYLESRIADLYDQAIPSNVEGAGWSDNEGENTYLILYERGRGGRSGSPMQDLENLLHLTHDAATNLAGEAITIRKRLEERS